jgi:hypothetical protein
MNSFDILRSNSTVEKLKNQKLHMRECDLRIISYVRKSHSCIFIYEKKDFSSVTFFINKKKQL